MTKSIYSFMDRIYAKVPLPDYIISQFALHEQQLYNQLMSDDKLSLNYILNGDRPGSISEEEEVNSTTTTVSPQLGRESPRDSPRGRVKNSTVWKNGSGKNNKYAPYAKLCNSSISIEKLRKRIDDHAAYVQTDEGRKWREQNKEEKERYQMSENDIRVVINSDYSPPTTPIPYTEPMSEEEKQAIDERNQTTKRVILGKSLKRNGVSHNRAWAIAFSKYPKL